MKSAKEYYRTYLADDGWSGLSSRLCKEILKYEPNHVLEFGAGSGKHVMWMRNAGIVACGLDISMGNANISHYKNDNDFLILGSEEHLRHLCNFDVVFTCSVLDHIPEVYAILQEFKRIANKAVILAETLDVPADYYYEHDYGSLGFRRLKFEWKSEADECVYYIWVWERPEDFHKKIIDGLIKFDEMSKKEDDGDV